MKKHFVFAEIGSTTTYITLSELDFENNTCRIICQDYSETTVRQNDISLGLIYALNKLIKKNPDLSYSEFSASSSAGGGLRITVHGLMKEMTVKAAKEAALGAGAVIKMITSGKLREYDIHTIKKTNPNSIIISGGTDYGERDTSIFNIKQLIEAELNIPIIYCGNIENREEVTSILRTQEHYIVDNVYPTIDEFNIIPLRKQIQSVFEKNIIYNTGFEKIKNIITGHIIPTPGAVFYAAELLFELIGDLLVIDVGGATTDIHSVCNDANENKNLIISPEPFAKRTVEGDLGVFINIKNIKDLLDNNFTDYTINEPFPNDEMDKQYITTLSLKAVEIALLRHTGKYKKTYNGFSESVITGKDLSEVRSIILTGGALTQITDLSNEIYDLIRSISKKNENLLLPKIIDKIYTDRNYIMAFSGYLSLDNKEIAKNLLTNYLLPNYVIPKAYNK